MSIKRVAELASARLTGTSGYGALSSAIHAGANCATKATPGAPSFTWMWYQNPVRLMSQSERLPS
jgi:hypothetical protein